VGSTGKPSSVCGEKKPPSIANELSLLTVHSSTQEISKRSSVRSLCCGFCHSRGILMKERLKLRPAIQLLPFASPVVTAVEVILGQSRRFLKASTSCASRVRKAECLSSTQTRHSFYIKDSNNTGDAIPVN